jgi:hypothetical protein
MSEFSSIRKSLKFSLSNRKSTNKRRKWLIAGFSMATSAAIHFPICNRQDGTYQVSQKQFLLGKASQTARWSSLLARVTADYQEF